MQNNFWQNKPKGGTSSKANEVITIALGKWKITLKREKISRTGR